MEATPMAVAPARAEIIVIDDFPSEALLPRTRPTGMDVSSWELAQKLQREDQDHLRAILDKTEALRRSNSSVARAALEERKKRKSQKAQKALRKQRMRLQQQETEDSSLAMALQIQMMEERKQPAVLSKNDVLNSLKPSQLRAVEFVTVKAQSMHQKYMERLKERVKKLGFSEENLQHCLEYIRNDAPIVIHLNEMTLSALVFDTHYRSLFETNTSGGLKSKESRHRWESNLFGGAYAEDSEPFDRPKYGCLNLTGDISGVSCARRYGAFFMTVRCHVRHRATFFSQDTGGIIGKTLATSEYYAHVFMDYTDEELRSVLDLLTGGIRARGAPCKCAQVKEVQIHGPVCLRKDILALSVPGKETAASGELREKVKAFQRKTGCNILWQGDLLSG